jgi:hypothetical protein
MSLLRLVSIAPVQYALSGCTAANVAGSAVGHGANADNAQRNGTDGYLRPRGWTYESTLGFAPYSDVTVQDPQSLDAAVDTLRSLQSKEGVKRISVLVEGHVAAGEPSLLALSRAKVVAAILRDAGVSGDAIVAAEAVANNETSSVTVRVLA